jgi:hypothetical protein
MPSPARDTTAGRIYNDLRNLARRTGAPTDQVMLEYLLERFLYRVSIHPLGRPHFVLKSLWNTRTAKPSTWRTSK